MGLQWVGANVTVVKDGLRTLESGRSAVRGLTQQPHAHEVDTYAHPVDVLTFSRRVARCSMPTQTCLRLVV